MRKPTGTLSLMLDLLTLVALLLVLGSFARRELAERRAGAAPAAAAGSEGAAVVGRELPRLEAVDARGASAAIDVTGAGVPHVLLVFRSDCPACAEQRPMWLELARAARARGAVVLAVTGEPLNSTVSSYLGDAAVEVRRATVAGQLGDVGVAIVPTTLLVNANGRIVDAAVGVRRDFDAMLDAVGAADEK